MAPSARAAPAIPEAELCREGNRGRLPRVEAAALLALLLGLGVFAILARVMAPVLLDDAFISYRYAENLAEGAGLTFNAGETPVEGYSNFLWILLSALVAKLGFSLVTWMPRIGILLGMASIGCFWLICRRRQLDPLTMLIAVLLFATSGPVLYYTVSGMETPLFLFLTVALVVVADSIFRRDRLLDWALFALVSILLFLTRPEGILAFCVAGAMIVALGFRRSLAPSIEWRRIRYPVAAFAAVTGAFVLYNAWRVQYFHELFPTPMLSKGGGGGRLSDAWWTNLQTYFEKQGGDTMAIAPFGYYYVALLALAVAGTLSRRSNGPGWKADVVALGLGATYALAYVNFVDWMPAMRYHAGLIGLLMLPAIRALADFFYASAGWARQAGWTYLARSAAVGLALLSVQLTGFRQLTVVAQSWDISPTLTIIPLANWLKAVAPPDALLATADVGMVPYFSGLDTLDIHPEALVDLTIAKNGWSADYVFARDPEIVLLFSRGTTVPSFAGARDALARDPRFADRYRLVGVTRLTWNEDGSYWVYAKKNGEVSEAEAATFPDGVGAGGADAS